MVPVGDDEVLGAPVSEVMDGIFHAFSGRIEADSAPYRRSIIIQAPREQYFIQRLATRLRGTFRSANDAIDFAFALVFFHASLTATASVVPLSAPTVLTLPYLE